MKRLLIFVIALQLITATAFAKNINLYLEPKTNSKVMGTVDPETGVTIVFTPKSGDWIKVANPTNGDVGWVQSSDIGGNGYQIHVTTSGDGTHTYNSYQFGTNTSQNSQQLESEMRQLEQQQRIMQAHMAQMFNDLFYFSQPEFIPVMMVPEQPKPQKTSAGKVSQTTQVPKPVQDSKN